MGSLSFLLRLPVIVLLSWFSFLSTYVDAKILDGDTQVQVLVGLETRLDSKEMNRIHSSPNHRLHLRDDKAALVEKAKAHISTCLDLYHSSIDDHNNNVSNGKGLEIISIAKDGSRFYLAGSVKDFISYFKNGRDNEGGLFVSFEEIKNDKNQATVVAKYEDGKSAKKFQQELEECNGFVGTFHRRRSRNDDNVEVSKTGYDDGRMLASLDPNEKFPGTCPLSPTSVENLKIYYETNPEEVPNYSNVIAAVPEVIRNIYGVPTLDGKCYRPRDSAVFEEGGIIDLNNFACFNEFYGLNGSVIQPVPISNTILIENFGPDFNAPSTGLCELPECTCSSGICIEPNLDVMMLSAMNAGTTIRSINYASDEGINAEYEDLIIQLTTLEEQENLPAVISISYGGCYDTTDAEVVLNLIEICNHIGVLTVEKGITFFVASGDSGANGSGGRRNGICGVYCQNALAACPYVTSVGGAFGNVPGEQTLSTGSSSGEQGLNVVSGGGFSNIFTEADFDLSYQKDAVESWRNQPEASRSLPGYTLPDGSVGAGFPDVSAKSDNVIFNLNDKPFVISGTSAASPIFAGIVNLCASQLPDDEVGFGWINHRLYQNSNNPEIFYDIVGGNNQYQTTGETCPPSTFTATCPINNVLKAFLRYDGSFGETVFVSIVQDDGSPNPATFVNRNVSSGESISFGFDNVNDGIFLNVGGVLVTIDITAPNPTDSFSIFRSTSCPGPWTIGTQAVLGFTLEGYIYEDEFGEPSTEVIGDGNFFGFQATPGWDPASGVGTIGTANGKGFEGLCELLLGRPFDFDEIECSCDASCTEFTCGDEALDCAGCEFCEEICDGFCSKFTCDAPQCRDCALCENRCDNFCNEFTCAAVAQCGNCEICQSPQPSSSPSKSAKKSKKAKKNK